MRPILLLACALPFAARQLSAILAHEGQRRAPVPSGALRMQRSFELAADRQAIQLLRDASLDPAALIEYLRMLSPVDQARIEAAQKAIHDLPQ